MVLDGAQTVEWTVFGGSLHFRRLSNQDEEPPAVAVDAASVAVINVTFLLWGSGGGGSQQCYHTHGSCCRSESPYSGTSGGSGIFLTSAIGWRVM